MKVLTLAAGFAAGYVLGTRAGRERFEQIAATARRVSAHPQVVQAQEKAKDLLGAGVHKVAATVGDSPSYSAGDSTSYGVGDNTSDSVSEIVDTTATKPRPPRRPKPEVVPTPTVTGDALA